MWRTLPLLAWRPGELTRRYIAGERARFVSPMALFLFSVFLMFAVFSLVGGPFTTTGVAAGKSRGRRRSRAGERPAGPAHRGPRAPARGTLAARRQPTAAIDAELRVLRQQRGALDTARSIVLVPSNAPEGTAKTVDLRGDVDTGWAWLDHAIRRRGKIPSLLVYKLQNNAYKFSWALIPISVPFVWLLFLHRRRYRAFKAYDHVVFVTYSIAFMSLGLVMLSLLRPLGVGQALIGLAFTFVPPIHIYRQLRGAYALALVQRAVAHGGAAGLRRRRGDDLLHAAAGARRARLRLRRGRDISGPAATSARRAPPSGRAGRAESRGNGRAARWNRSARARRAGNRPGGGRPARPPGARPARRRPRP